MDLKQTVDNLGGTDAVEETDQLASVWGTATPAANRPQIEATLAADDARRSQKISQTEAAIAAEQKQVDANEQAIAAGNAATSAIDLEVARVQGREDELEAEAALLEKAQGPAQ